MKWKIIINDWMYVGFREFETKKEAERYAKLFVKGKFKYKIERIK